MFKFNIVFQPKLAKSDAGKLALNESLALYTGVISSRIYGSSRNTVGEVETYIRHDIIRSLTTRMQIYYDALLANDDGGNDNETDKEDVNNNVLPRRVFFPVGDICFGDYLFQNETAETTVKQTMDTLGLELSPSDVDTKVEAIAQLGSSGQDKSENVCDSNDENVSLKKFSGRLLVIIGAFIAVIVALILKLLLK